MAIMTTVRPTLNACAPQTEPNWSIATPRAKSCTWGRSLSSSRLPPRLQVRRDPRADRVQRVGVEFGDLEHRAQHAQYLPCGTRIALRLHRRVERLHAPFHVDVRAAAFRPGRDWQHHVRRLGGCIAV